MTDRANGQILSLLTEIRDLLIPVSDEFRAAYEEREAVRGLICQVVNTPQRERMYKLMNGTRTQVEIAERVGVTQGAVSRFISSASEHGLVEMVRVGAGERPARKYDIPTGRRLGGQAR